MHDRRGRGLAVLLGGMALVAGLALALGLGLLGTGRGKSHPSLSVAPASGLVGGQRLHVRLAGFPRHATVELYECARVPRPGAGGCGAAAGGIGILVAGGDGRASGSFVAQPAAGGGPGGVQVGCRDRCVLVAVAIKLPRGAPARPLPMASARLSFSARPAPLADADVEALSWVGPDIGWALAAQPCATGSCVRLLRTGDGGERWRTLPSPPARFADGAYECPRRACVSDVSFANRRVGYLWGPALLMTTDGGRSWTAQLGPFVETLAVAGANAYRVAYRQLGCPGPCQPILQAAPIGSKRWHTLIAGLATPDRSASAQIVASGSTLLMALYGSQAGPVSAHAIVYRSTDAGAAWTWGGDPCASRASQTGREEDLIAIAAAPGGFFAGLCTSHEYTPGGFVVTSTDAGASWRVAGTLPPVQRPALIAAAGPTTLAVSTGVISGDGPFTARLLTSTDGGRRWVLAASDRQQLTQDGVPAWLGFQSSRAGSWIGDPHGIWSTRHGAARWTRTALR